MNVPYTHDNRIHQETTLTFIKNNYYLDSQLFIMCHNRVKDGFDHKSPALRWKNYAVWLASHAFDVIMVNLVMHEALTLYELRR